MRGIPHLGCAVLLLAACGPDRPERGTLPPLHYLATADQAGPVAYRDPVGAISPDGNWLATLERGQIRFTPSAGGAAQRIGPGTASIRYLTWFPDSRRVLVHENVFDRSRQEWRVYDRADGSRSPLWPDRPVDVEPATGALTQLSWSADGAAIAGVTRSGDISTVWALNAGGGNAAAQASGERLSFPAWSPDGRIACLVRNGIGSACTYRVRPPNRYSTIRKPTDGSRFRRMGSGSSTGSPVTGVSWTSGCAG